MKSILSHIKTFLEISAAVGVLWGAFKFINSSQETTGTVKDLAKRFDNVENSVKMVSDTLAAVGKKVDRQGRQLSGLKSSFTNYLLRDKTLTKDEFFEYMSTMQQSKKNE